MTEEQKEIIKKAAAGYYGEDRVDFAEGAQLDITVYYPEITMATVPGGAEHVLAECYAMLRLGPGAYSVRFGRTKLTRAELAVGYVHSHRRLGGVSELLPFCMGDGSTPFNKAAFRLAEKLYSGSPITEHEAVSLLMLMDRSLETESLDGGPYATYASLEAKLQGAPPMEFVPLAMRRRSLSGCRLREFFEFFEQLKPYGMRYDGRCWQPDCSDSEFLSMATKAARAYEGSKPSWYRGAFESGGLFYGADGPGRATRLPKKAAWTFKGKQLAMSLAGDSGPKPQKVLREDICNALYSFVANAENATRCPQVFKSVKDGNERRKKIIGYVLDAVLGKD